MQGQRSGESTRLPRRHMWVYFVGSLIFSTNVQPKELLDIMKENAKDGNLGRLRVDPASMKIVSLEPKGNRIHTE